mgnify:FL=1
MTLIKPLYYKAFKYLIENERLTKKVRSILSDKEILDKSISQQETVLNKEKLENIL